MTKRTYSFVLIVAFLSCLLTLSAQAQIQSLPKSITWAQATEAYDALPGNLTNTFGTQCGDRAHVWSYILKSKFNIDSQKVFLYFTPKSYNHTGMRWGFHVVTLINIDGEEHIIEKIPGYEVRHDPKWNYVLKDDLLFQAPIPMHEWLNIHTGYSACKELDMNNPADKKDFKAFNSVKVYKSSEDCVLSKTPSVYWWPVSVYKAVKKGRVITKDSPDLSTALMACDNIMPGATKAERDAACKTLLNP